MHVAVGQGGGKDLTTSNSSADLYQCQELTSIQSNLDGRRCTVLEELLLCKKDSYEIFIETLRSNLSLLSWWVARRRFEAQVRQHHNTAA